MTNLPRDVKDAVSKCRAATQEALKNRISRMDVEFPVGTKFGVEKDAVSKKKKSNKLLPNNKKTTTTTTNSNVIEGGPTREQLDLSDRELARLFVEMFQPVGVENIVVAFTDQRLADQAKRKWKDDTSSSSCRILALNRRRMDKKKAMAAAKKNKPKGFAAKLAAEVDDDTAASGGGGGGGPFQLPETCEVALFVAPGPKELIVIEKICNQVGMGTLVILLNARLSLLQQQEQQQKVTIFGTKATEQLFTQDFESIFCLSAAPQEEAPNCLLYRAYPNDWILARKPKVGPPKPILQQTTKPTTQQCQHAYDSLELSDVEKGVETALENVAGWFR